MNNSCMQFWTNLAILLDASSITFDWFLLLSSTNYIQVLLNCVRLQTSCTLKHMV